MTAEEQMLVRLLSDGVIYEVAESFVSRHGSFADDEQGRKQVNGLLKYARDGFAVLNEYARKQGARDWRGNKEHYKPIYQALQQELKAIARLAKQHDLVSADLADSKLFTTEVADTLVREFIQHLAAEMLYRKGGE